MSWFFLFFAIILEVSGTIAMKYSEGFTRIGPTLFLFTCYFSSLYFVTISLKNIDLSVAYAVWAGLGTALIALIGFFYFKEDMSTIRIFSIFLIILGVIGLNLESTGH